jgi:subtilase family serine protease
MKTNCWITRNVILLSSLLLVFSATRADAQGTGTTSPVASQKVVPARVTEPVDDAKTVVLKGNVHPLARAEFDRGAVLAGQPMKRMLLLLRRSPEQQAALQELMSEQQSKSSPNFHKWLTPQQFGAQFGPADSDIQTVTDWLAREGFQGVKVANGRTAIEFSGTAAQVQNSFHTEIHSFLVSGQTYSANAKDPQIPAALVPVVGGLVSLHNFPRKSFRRDAGIHKMNLDEHGTPQFTSSGGCGASGASPCFLVGPADFAKIYNIPSTLTGANVTIGIVGDSNIDPNDAVNFRTLFGLTPTTGPTIILDGPDPGMNGDEGEADLDTQVSGMVAPQATIDFVTAEGTLTTSGTDLAAFHIIDYNLADVMSESFGSCELALGTNGVQFYDSLWEEAAAQGITVMVSAGDNGSGACEDFNTESVATQGLSVNGIASTPFNVAVGGTDFDDAGTQSTFWNSTNTTDGTRESAKGYIPETTWNDSCAATATSANLATVCAGALATNVVGGSGGPSAANSKPGFQNGVTPADTFRDLPDVSLFASNGPVSFSFYPNCEADLVPAGGAPSCAPNGQGMFTLGGAGGTSASSPAFAGIMALIVQNNGRQGNANFVLYKLAQTPANSCNSSTQPLSPPATCIFYDVIKGNNSIPCAGTSSNCSSATSANGVLVDPAHPTTPAWTTAPGYDYATGLGSVNVANLATAWPTVVGTLKGTTTALTLNGGTAQVTITHGTNVTASATVAVVSPATGIPTGDVSLLGPKGTINSGINANTLSGATPDTVSLSTTTLPGGGPYSVTAHYTGDGTFGPSDSNAISVKVNPENSRLQMSVVTLDPASGNILNANATAYIYGSLTFLRFDILNSSANPCQILVVGGNTTGCAFDAQGSVTVTNNASPLDGGTFKINSAGDAEDQNLALPAGTNTLSATYSGDVNYNPVTTPVTAAIVVSKAPTATNLSADHTTATTAQTVTLTATIQPQTIGLAPTGTITFSTCGTPPCTATLVPTNSNANTGTFAFSTATLPTIFTTAGTENITATYSGDTNYAASPASAPVTVTVTQAQIGSFAVSYNPATLTLSSSTGAAMAETVTVTPTGGFTGTVMVTPSPLPPGVTCTPSPLSISVTGAAAVPGTLNCMVTATSGTLTASNVWDDRMQQAKAIPPTTGGKGWWTLSAGTGFATLFLLFLPGGRKKYRAALGLGLVCILSFTLGCGGGYGGGGGGGITQAATVTKLTVPAGKELSGTPFTFSVSVTGGTPAPSGMVQLFDGGTMIGTATAVSGGTATPTAPALSVGTHAISAHFLGDTYNTASASGTLNLTVTGSTTIAITTTPAASPAAAPLNITIN